MCTLNSVLIFCCNDGFLQNFMYMLMSGESCSCVQGPVEGRDIGPSGTVVRNGCELLDISTRNLTEIP